MEQHSQRRQSGLGVLEQRFANDIIEVLTPQTTQERMADKEFWVRFHAELEEVINHFQTETGVPMKQARIIDLLGFAYMKQKGADHKE